MQNERLKGLVHKNTSNEKNVCFFAVVICDAKHFDNLQIRIGVSSFLQIWGVSDHAAMKYSE